MSLNFDYLLTFENTEFIVPAGITGIIRSSSYIIFEVYSPYADSLNINILGTLIVKNNATIMIYGNHSKTPFLFNVNSGGKLIFESTGLIQYLTYYNNYKLKINFFSGATLVTANANGINGSIKPYYSPYELNFTGLYLSPEANYEFNGLAQTTSGLPSTVHDLIFSNEGIKTLAGNVTVTNDLKLMIKQVYTLLLHKQLRLKQY